MADGSHLEIYPELFRDRHFTVLLYIQNVTASQSSCEHLKELTPWTMQHLGMIYSILKHPYPSSLWVHQLLVAYLLHMALGTAGTNKSNKKLDEWYTFPVLCPLHHFHIHSSIHPFIHTSIHTSISSNKYWERLKFFYHITLDYKLYKYSHHFSFYCNST